MIEKDIELSESIKKVKLEKGDIVVLTSERILSDKQRERIKNDLIRQLPEGVKAVLLDGGLSLSVLTNEIKEEG